MSSLVISAPGKVLIAGGYLVLDPAYSGVVASTSSRFYTAITPGNANCIVVRSPQFIDATWSYTWSISRTTAPPSVVVSQVERYLAYGQLWRLPFFLIAAYYLISSDASKNKFVHLALQKTLSLALEAKGPAELEQALGDGLDVTIVGDNDFYSQQDQARIPSPSPIPDPLVELNRPSIFL
jgi:phosphomevalonate kinase